MTSGIEYRKADRRDYPGMLALQKANYIGNLTKSEAQNGFLSIEYREEQFDEINRDLGIAVALYESRVVGYVCGTSFDYSARFPILNCLMQHASGHLIGDTGINAQTTFVYGPVCIDASFRGSTVLAGLFETLKTITRPRYDLCVLFISDGNPRSLKAHGRKLGMRNFGSFEFDSRMFQMFGASVKPQ